MTFDGAGRAYIAWTERGFAALRGSADDGDSRILLTTTTDGRTFTAPIVVDNYVTSEITGDTTPVPGIN